ncbi:putative phosphoglycerate mutase (2,3-diphosphoglycerate-independent) [Helianthus annuus]|nr:putative phosphoglycerate mutase (2,3-diphosphoglycerate-independent) [Helianthus annuus]
MMTWGAVNALGAGRIFAQGAKLVDNALASGKIYEDEGFSYIKESFANNTLYLIGLMSDVDVHSRLNQLQLLLKGASERDAKRIRVHVLTDGRDVVDGSSVGFAETLEKDLAELRGKGIDAQVASGSVLLEFIVAVVWQLVEAALGDEGLLELTKERTYKWNVPQDMEIKKRNEILQGRNTVMAVELIGLFLQNQITSRILLLARRNMPTHWRSLV